MRKRGVCVHPRSGSVSVESIRRNHRYLAHVLRIYAETGGYATYNYAEMGVASRADLDANTRKVMCSHPQMVTTHKDADDAIP